MKMEYIREFVVLGRCLNFTKASAELFISQTTLSRHIALIEEELGQKLLQRDSHSVELTQAGGITLEFFRGIAEQYNSYLEQMERLKKGAHGQLRLAECYYAVDRYLSGPLSRFKQMFPQVDVELLALQPYEAKRAVLEGRADMGMALLYGARRDERLIYREITHESFCFCIPSDHPLARRRKLRFSDLNGEIVLISRNEVEYRDYIEFFFKKYDVHPQKWIYGEQADSVNYTILGERGIAVQPEHLKDLPHRGITFVPVDEPDCYLTIAFIHRKDNRNPTVKLFLDSLKK